MAVPNGGGVFGRISPGFAAEMKKRKTTLGVREWSSDYNVFDVIPERRNQFSGGEET